MDAELGELLPAEIVAALERGATVVTGNQRAARTLRLQFDRRNRTLGRTNWQPAKVQAWDAWVTGGWSRLVMAGMTRLVLLNRSQELALWRAVIEADKELRSLRAVDSLAEMAAEAWRLLWSYNGQGSLRALGVSTDTKAFQRWSFGFERRCRADGLLARAGLEEALRSNLPAEMAVGELMLVGFDALTPAQIGLIETLREAGAVVGELRLGDPATEKLLVVAEDDAEEMRACAAWARDFLKEQEGARVAVIVPGLEGQRAEMERVFRAVLAPELEDIAAGSEGTPFEFSVGVPLAATQMVITAVNLLHWMNGPLPLERVSGLLLSPYFAGGGAGISARAEFDAYVLRKMTMLRPEISVEALLGRMAGRPKLAETVAALRRMEQAARRFAKDDARTHADWAEAMRDVLKAAEWGRGEGEDSIEFQIRTKWESALDELATLDLDGVGLRFDSALKELELIAQRTMFAPESHDAAVQVMGPLEAAGSGFDAVWFLRVGELTWPMKGASNSLLPWHLQRELGMPGDPARDMEFARGVTQRIAASAPVVMFSYARQGGEDAGRQRPSAALSGMEFEEVAAADLLDSEEMRKIVALEIEDDDEPLPALPAGVIRGGAAVLEAQAACGFLAFAERRLFSAKIEAMEVGFDARKSGVVVHKVLEEFWRRTETQGALKELTGWEREMRLAECIDVALGRASNAVRTPWEVAYLATQKVRLANLIRPWLDREAERPPFRVEMSEREYKDVSIGPLRLDVRVDRIDVLEDGPGAGGLVILDYKTGKAMPSEWLGDRPDAPQLPLYALVTEGELQGVAFAQIRAGKDLVMRGFQAKDGVLAKWSRDQTQDLNEHVMEWRRVLTRLAEDFSDGRAAVSPKNYPRTCEYCAQRLLCRLDVAAIDADGEDSEDATNGDGDERD